MGRLKEIHEQMLELLEEAKTIVRHKKDTHRSVYERMKAYWHPHIQMALTKDHEYLGNDGATMEEAVNAIEGGDTLEALVEYAEGVDLAELLEEMGYDAGQFPTIEACIKHALEDNEDDPDSIRESIDNVTPEE